MERLTMTASPARRWPTIRSLIATTLLLGTLVLPAPPAHAQFPPDYTSGNYLFILTSEYDYTGGSYSLMDCNQPWEHDDNLAGMCGDAVAREHGGLIYVIGRWGCDYIQVIDPAQGFQTTLQFSTGTGSNPQDICFVDERRAFISRYEETDLWEVDPTTGEHTDSIDLSPLADSDGIPEMHALAIHGERLFVALQRLDRDYHWLPAPPSYLAVIDLTDNTLIDMDPVSPGMQGIPLISLSPNSWIVTDPLSGDLLVGQVGEYGLADGGIERIDPATGESLGMIVTEETLGGDLNMWATGEGMRGYAIVVGGDWSTKIEAFDLQTGQSRGTVTTAGEYAYTHLWVDLARQQLFVCDRTYANPGVRVFSTSDHSPLTPQPIMVGLYPFWLCGMQGDEAGIQDAPSYAGQLHLEVFPQPAIGSATLRFQLPASRDARIEILDLQGRPIAQRCIAARPGIQEIRWDPSSDPTLPTGTYWIRLRCSAGEQIRKLQFLKQ